MRFLLFIKFLQTKPRDKSWNIPYYDLHYNVIENRDEKGEEELDKNHDNFNYFYDNKIMPNYDTGNKPRETISK